MNGVGCKKARGNEKGKRSQVNRKKDCNERRNTTKYEKACNRQNGSSASVGNGHGRRHKKRPKHENSENISGETRRNGNVNKRHGRNHRVSGDEVGPDRYEEYGESLICRVRSSEYKREYNHEKVGNCDR